MSRFDLTGFGCGKVQAANVASQLLQRWREGYKRLKDETGSKSQSP